MMQKIENGIVRHSSEMFRTIEAVDGKLNVLTYNLDHASYESFGIAKGDEETINEQKGVFIVNTEGVKHAEESTYGIVRSDGKTISINDGEIKVNTGNLEYDI